METNGCIDPGVAITIITPQRAVKWELVLSQSTLLLRLSPSLKSSDALTAGSKMLLLPIQNSADVLSAGLKILYKL